MLYFGYGSNLDHEDWTRWGTKKQLDPTGLKQILSDRYLEFC